MWERVEILINDIPINSSCGDYGYRSFLTDTLNYSSSAKESILALSGYEYDSYSNGSTKFVESATLREWREEKEKK